MGHDMDRNPMLSMLHKRFRFVTTEHDAEKNVTRLTLSNNGHVSIDLTVESLEKLDATMREEVLSGLEKVLALEP